MHRDGGVPALLKALEPLLDLDAMTVTGQTLAEVLADKEGPQAWQDTVRTLGDPLGPAGALVTLKGSLAPDGAVLKAAAASEHLLVHEGPAAVFDSLTDVQARLDDESLRLTAGHVLIMRNIGPIGAGMPEAGSIPIPKYLAREGIRDMVRISDGRMSGTAYGTIVLHCAPEAALGGPLALVCDGDRIKLDVPSRRVDLLVDDAELDRRRADLQLPALPDRGWSRLYARSVVQAPEGADLDFLR
jgi:dihydroxy-acid dehydratase